MNLGTRPRDAAELDEPTDAHAEYIAVRAIDALLREDVRACVTRATVVGNDGLPQGFSDGADDEQQWLHITHFGLNRLWIPVVRERFMQPWRCARRAPVWCSAAGCRRLHDIADILTCFRTGLDEQAARGFIEFERECATALAHRRAAEAARERWFDDWREVHAQACGTDLVDWHERLLHYERLAAFLDHPFYPTARAKLGFGAEDLARYAPEFRPCFELNWLAVPRTLHHSIGGPLPPGWPRFTEIELPATLADTHVLVPVHPFVWEHALDHFLADSPFASQVVRAPQTALRVTPTLSVRTLALCDATGWHVKLPLTIRTLGAKNIRTIKPSTLHDGRCIQALLGAIAEREAELRGRVLLTAEDSGAHVAHTNYLGYIVRRYPIKPLSDATLVPVAALAAPTPNGRTVVEEIIDRFFDGDGYAFLDAYLDLTLRWHLVLWLRYGVALESNQQNSVLVLSEAEPRLRLLLKDNDAARIERDALMRRWPALGAHVAQLEDVRIVVSDALPLAQMFTTITLQLNIAAPIEHLARVYGQEPRVLYGIVRRHIERLLDELRRAGEDVAYARQTLLDDEHLYIKYLLIAATLAEKTVTGATDVNKYYGRSAPNFLKECG